MANWTPRDKFHFKVNLAVLILLLIVMASLLLFDKEFKGTIVGSSSCPIKIFTLS